MAETLWKCGRCGQIQETTVPAHRVNITKVDLSRRNIFGVNIPILPPELEVDLCDKCAEGVHATAHAPEELECTCMENHRVGRDDMPNPSCPVHGVISIDPVADGLARAGNNEAASWRVASQYNHDRWIAAEKRARHFEAAYRAEEGTRRYMEEELLKRTDDC